MHIKPFLLISILIGAAAILPIHTYAQNNRGNDHSSNKAEVHTEAEVQEKKIEKSLPEPRKQSDQNRQVKNPGPPQEMPEKAQAPKVDKRPERAVPPGINHKVEAQKRRSVKAASMDNRTVDTMNAKDADPRKKTAVKASDKPLIVVEKPKVKVTDEQLSYAVSKAVVKEIESPVKKRTSSRTSVQKPIQKPIQKPVTPLPAEKQPVDLEVSQPSPHRNQPSGGKTQDLPGMGAGATSFIDAGFYWETGLYLGNIYHASDVQYWYQWMNAPPSPPPEKTPFLTVYN